MSDLLLDFRLFMCSLSIVSSVHVTLFLGGFNFIYMTLTSSFGASSISVTVALAAALVTISKFDCIFVYGQTFLQD